MRTKFDIYMYVLIPMMHVKYISKHREIISKDLV